MKNVIAFFASAFLITVCFIAWLGNPKKEAVVAYNPVQWAPMTMNNVSSNSTTVIPAGYSILQVVVQNTTGNSVTGGIKIGTTNGGTDVILALPILANDLFVISDASLSKKIFSMSSDQTLYVQAVTLWNSANLNFYFVLRKVN